MANTDLHYYLYSVISTLFLGGGLKLKSEFIVVYFCFKNQTLELMFKIFIGHDYF